MKPLSLKAAQTAVSKNDVKSAQKTFKINQISLIYVNRSIIRDIYFNFNVLVTLIHQ